MKVPMRENIVTDSVQIEKTSKAIMRQEIIENRRKQAVEVERGRNGRLCTVTCGKTRDS